MPSFPSHGQQNINPVLVRQEVAQNVCRRRGRVWHMHGEASCPASIVASKNVYGEALTGVKAAEQQEDSWLYQFLHSTVFICGLALRPDEELLIHVLRLRTELPKERRHPVVYLHFRRKGAAEGSRESVIKLLKGFDVKLIEIPVYTYQGKEDYQSAWYHLMGWIWENTAKKLPVAPPSSNSAERGICSSSSVSSSSRGTPAPVSYGSPASVPAPAPHFTPATSSPGTPAPKPRYTPTPNDRKRRFRSGRYECVVRTSTPTALNPHRCWINIGVEKLRANRDKDWIFKCFIDDVLYVYHYPSRELEQIFVENEVAILETGTPRYNLYIDYRRGELYSTVNAVDMFPLVVLKRGASPSARYPQD